MDQTTDINDKVADGDRANNEDAAFTEKLKAVLSRTRDRLVDRNLRNKLISTNLSATRTKSVRIFGSQSEFVFSKLLLEKFEFSFVAAGEVDEENQNYPLVVASEQKVAGNELATRLSKDGLKKKLRALYYEAREVEEEQGVNLLFLALGFLKWYESDSSDTERFAPLVLIPVELSRSGAQDAFKLKIRDDDLFTNISLKLWLREQNSITLPDIPEDDIWSITEYFKKVRESVQGEKRWEVIDNESVLGLFSFNKFMLWRDLDPDTWPQGYGLLEHPVIRQLLLPPKDLGDPEPPVIDPDELIDDHFTPQDLCYVVDADSSQTEAIQTVLAGKHLVIQGPPGTGKSQTITNIIAAAVKQGKRVLFVAEKMAALNVVHDRLEKAGLKVITLELHSRKATKSGVLQQIRESVDSKAYPAVADKVFNSLVESQTFLNSHANRVNSVRLPWGMSAFEIIGEISKLQRRGLNLFNFDIPNANKYSNKTIAELTEKLKKLTDRLAISGVPSRHPWRESTVEILTPMDIDRLAINLEHLTIKLDEIHQTLLMLGQSLSVEAETFCALNLGELRRLSIIAGQIETAPKVSTQVLSNTKLQTQRAEILNIASKLEDLKSSLKSISDQLIADWESCDLVKLRTQFAGSGGRLFSIFSKVYRSSVAEFKGMSKDGLPKGFKNQLALLDNALLAKRVKSEINDFDVDVRLALGEAWQADRSDPELLLSISRWYESIGIVDETQLSIIAKLFSDSKSRAEFILLANRIDEVEISMKSVCDAVRFNENSYKTKSIGALRNEFHFYLKNIDRLNEWPNVRGAMIELKGEIGDSCYSAIYDGSIQAEHIVPAIRVSILEKIWKDLVVEDESLSRVDAFTLDRYLETFKAADRNRLEVAKAEVLHAYSNARPNGSTGQMAVIRQELEKKSRLFPVRKLMNRAGQAVHSLKPVFLMSPMSIAQFLEPGTVTFDLLLIDEASQIRPEDALGAIARARQVVVVGDSKQLPPTSFFSRLSEDTDDSSDDIENDGNFLEEVESVLGLCSGVFKNNLMLRWHYRSQHPGLIAVSNRNFYEDKLLLPPSVLRAKSSSSLGVSLISSPPNGYQRGGPDGGRNVLEAELIAKEVINFARTSPDKSLGVAAFSVKQRDAIRDLIDEYRSKNPDLEPFFSVTKDEPFFVKNLESIQGDERDVIFISVGYGRDTDGRLTQAFGPLGIDGGERRLNVLISRAKERCTVFSSITAQDIQPVAGKLGVNAFREFLQFAQSGYFDVPINTGRDFDSEFEESVALFLISSGFTVEPQVGMVGFFIDIGIVDPNNETRFICGIECDGATYHSSRSARDRDRLKQDILEARGWNIYRIWSTDWFHRRQSQEQKLLDYLSNLQSSDTVQREAPVIAIDDGVDEDEDDSTQVQVIATSPSFDKAVYQEYVHERTYSGEPHEQHISVLKDLVFKIVECEGPIHQDEVAKRVAKCHGLERTGGRIRSVTQNALRLAPGLRHSGPFWKTSESIELVVRDRSMVLSSGLKSAEYLPPEEIDVALCRIIKESVRIEEAELIQQTSRMFGFSRCGPDLRKAIKHVLDKNIAGNIKSDGSEYFID